MQKRLELFNKHEKIVYGIMKRHHIIRGNDLFEDVSQAAFLALWKATETFDPTKASFTTHAFWKIRESVQRSLDGIPIVNLGRYEIMLKRTKTVKFYSLNYLYSDGEKDTLNLLNLIPDEGLQIKEEEEENQHKLSVIKEAIKNVKLSEQEQSELEHYLETGKKGRMVGSGKSRQYNNWVLANALAKIRKWIKTHEEV